jgi:hypothetical protein
MPNLIRGTQKINGGKSELRRQKLEARKSEVRSQNEEVKYPIAATSAF